VKIGRAPLGRESGRLLTARARYGKARALMGRKPHGAALTRALY